MGNFSFMKKQWFDLSKLGELAEEYIYSDSNGAMLKIGQMAEIIMKYIFSEERFDSYAKVNQAERINKIEADGIASNKICQYFDSIRRDRNVAAHEGIIDVDRALSDLEKIYCISVWFVEKYTGPFNPIAFEVPKERKMQIVDPGQNTAIFDEKIQKINDSLDGIFAKIQEIETTSKQNNPIEQGLFEKQCKDGKDVVIQEEKWDTPYRLEGKEYTDEDMLFEALFLNWETGKEHIKCGLISNFFKTLNTDIAFYSLKMEQENTVTDLDYWDFLNKNEQLSKKLFWRGIQWKNISELGDFIVKAYEEKDTRLMEICCSMVSSNILEVYCGKTVEKEIIDSPVKMVAAGYDLCIKKNYYFENEAFSNLEDFMEFLYQKLEMNTDCYMETVQKLTVKENLNFFITWLSKLGYDDELNQWRSLQKRNMIGLFTCLNHVRKERAKKLQQMKTRGTFEAYVPEENSICVDGICPIHFTKLDEVLVTYPNDYTLTAYNRHIFQYCRPCKKYFVSNKAVEGKMISIRSLPVKMNAKNKFLCKECNKVFLITDEELEIVGAKQITRCIECEKKFQRIRKALGY